MSPLVGFLLGFASATALAGGLFAWYRGRVDRRRTARERTHEEELEALRRQARERIERLERELRELERTGHVDFGKALLPALDSVAGAVDRAREVDELEEEFEQGLQMALRRLHSVLENHDIEAIEPDEGSNFDPDRHRALRAVDDAEVEPGRVVLCHRRGYRFEQRVLRPAEVEVSVAEEEQSEGPAGESPDGDRADVEETSEASEPAPEAAPAESSTEEPSPADEPSAGGSEES
ncbi:MAG: nucleotide exchange factor GrpE [Bradymonadaceae bacterium]